jgi:type I restriction enzyme S subunit
MIEKLPDNWVVVKFTDILDIKGGTQPAKDAFIYEPKDGYIRLLQIRDFGDKPFPTYIPMSNKLRLVNKNEILLARYGGTASGDSLGRVCTGMEGAYNVALVKLEFFEDIIPASFIKYLLGASFFTNVISKNSRSCQTGFNKNDLFEVHFPFPPANEQKRIVTKLDQIMPRIDAVKERLDKVPTIIKRFRQSVLTAAVTGKLTEQWRDEHPAVVSSFNTNAMSEKMANSYLNVFEETQLFDIPDTWVYVPVCDLGEIRGGGTPSKANSAFWQGDMPWISPKDMKVDRISSGIDFISYEAIKQSSTKVIPKSSILFVVRGMILVHTFPVAITLNDLTINQDMKALLPNEKNESEYLFLVFKQIGNKVLIYIKEATHGTLRLEMPLFETFAIPIPPIEEQQEIVRQVDKLFAIADKLETHYQKAKARVDKLSQSVLAKAFRGELVMSEAELAAIEGRDFESAEKLLERIIKEKQIKKK